MKLNETDRKRLGQFLDTLSLTPFRNEMIKRGSLTVSRQTIISELNSLDWEKRRTFYASPFLTERQKQKKQKKAFRLVPRPQQLRLGERFLHR